MNTKQYLSLQKDLDKAAKKGADAVRQLVVRVKLMKDDVRRQSFLEQCAIVIATLEAQS